MLKILKPALAPGRAFNLKTNKKNLASAAEPAQTEGGAVYFFL
jgi:hypothetical protein